MTRDELIWKMAEAAWQAHFCVWSGDHTSCDNCRSDGKCFELGNGFRESAYDRDEWYLTAEGALEALEAALGIRVTLGELPLPTPHAQLPSQP